MAATARIVVLFSVISCLLFLSAAAFRVAVLPSASHEDDGRTSLPSEEETTTTVSLPSSIPVDGFQQVDLTLRRPVDVHRLHHVHLHGMEHEKDEYFRGRHHHHHHDGHHHNHEGFVIPYGDDMLMGENSMPGKDEGLKKEVGEVEIAERGALEEVKESTPAPLDWDLRNMFRDKTEFRRHHHHHHRHDGHHNNHEGFVIPYGDDMLMGENSMPVKDEGLEKETGERGALEEVKEWTPASADWEQAAEERRRHRKVKCEHKKKRPHEEDSDSDDEEDDEAEMMKKELKRMRKKERKERKKREEGGWMSWFSGFWNGF